jgi:hypothetical protein
MRWDAASVQRTRRSHFWMSPIRKGRMWRVQIMQPDGSVRYFGRFSSEKRAREWIAVHALLTNHLTENGDYPPALGLPRCD